MLREVHFDIPTVDVSILKHLPGLEDFNPATETLSMIKPIYGLKDAPRLWRKRLHRFLTEKLKMIQRWKLKSL